MPNMTGKVLCVQVGDMAGFTQIEDATGDREVFILWFNPGAQIPSQLTSFTRVLHSMWLSLLREAQTNNTNVTISHPQGSSEVITSGWATSRQGVASQLTYRGVSVQ